MKFKARSIFSKIESGDFEPDRVLPHGETCLHLASREGCASIIEALVLYHNSKAILSKDHDGKCPIHEAVIYNKVECVKVLLKHGSPVNPLKRSDWTPLMHACENANYEIFKILVDAGANINLVNKDGWSSLHLASRSGSLEIVKFLIEKDPNLVLLKTTNGRTALHCASLNNREKICEYFLENKSFGIDVQDSCGTTALCDAIKTDNVSIINLFYKFSADLKIPDSNGNYPVHIACQTDCCNSLKILINLGVDPKAPSINSTGNNCAQFAVSCNSLNCITFLLQFDSKLFTLEDNGGVTALDLVNSSRTLGLVKTCFPNAQMVKTENKYKLNDLLK